MSNQVVDHLAGHIQKRKEEDSRLYHLFLTRRLLQNGTGEGYRALARLIREGYFSKILTVNMDTALEFALEEQGLHASEYEVLVVGQDSDEQIAATLDGQKSGIHIVKLYGKQAQSEQTSSSSELPAVIQISLQRYFNQNIVIVGCMDQEQNGIDALQFHKDGSIYYVRENSPPIEDIIVKRLYKQDKQLSDFLITGEHGEFDTFFSTLETRINERAGRKQSLRTAAHRNTTSTYNVSPSHNHSNGLSPASGEKAVPELQKQPSVSPATTSPLHPLTAVLKDTKKALRASARASTDVLFITVTDIEAQAIFDLFPSRSERTIDGRVYYDLGLVGSAKIFMAQATGTGPAHARVCIEAGIQALAPQVVVMVGIAFGLHPETQRIGDILVSQQIEDYEQQKIGTGSNGEREFYARGDRVGASERLLSHFRAGRHNWQSPREIHFGLILSGSKLVSHKGFRDELLSVAPQAIGGEMEGISLYETCKHTHVEWILVKAICDWGDADKNDAHQKQAADNAARFVVQVVSREQFVRQR